MFEPLRDLLGHHAENLGYHLRGLREAVDRNTEAQAELSQSARKTLRVGKGETEELRNDSGFGWRIKWLAATAECDVRLGVNSDEGFMRRFKPHEGEKVEWYIPPGGIIFVVNIDEANDGSTNFEIEVLEISAMPAHTGTSEEHIDVPRYEPVPSGSPLDEPVAP